MVCSVSCSQGFPWMLSPRGPVAWGWTSSALCQPWPFPSSPPNGRRAVRLSLVAIPLKAEPGLLHLPIAQHPRVPPRRAVLLGNAGASPITF